MLGGLSSNTGFQRDLRDENSNDEQLDIKFNVGFGEDLGKKALKDKK